MVTLKTVYFAIVHSHVANKASVRIYGSTTEKHLDILLLQLKRALRARAMMKSKLRYGQAYFAETGILTVNGLFILVYRTLFTMFHNFTLLCQLKIHITT